MSAADENRLAEIEAELAPLTAQYNSLRKQMEPLWAARKKFQAVLDAHKTAERDKRHEERDALDRAKTEARNKREDAALRLYGEGKSLTEIETIVPANDVARGHAKNRARLVIGWAASRIIEDREWGSELLPAALKWKKDNGDHPIVNVDGASPEDVARLEAAFKEAGFHVSYQKLSVGRIGDGGFLQSRVMGVA